MSRPLAIAKSCLLSLVALGLAASQAIGSWLPLRPSVRTKGEGDDVAGWLSKGAALNAPSDRLRIVPNPVVGAFAERVAGGLAQDRAILTRMLDLAEKASQGTAVTTERYELNRIFASELVHIAEVVETTRYGELEVLSGDCDVLLQGRPPMGTLIFLDLPDVTPAGLGLTSPSLGLGTMASANAALQPVDQALQTVAEYRADLQRAWLQVRR